MACGCGKEFAKATEELKKIRQTAQDIATSLASMSRALEQQFEANKEEPDRESQ